ncbi:hypothetical protein AAFF_G00036330 [Aldrovandia affinis]|uniref:Agrin Agrin N-terminal 110 kDa subunit n=1 Tax=Aldrovandia affinis TaxID=143900 RepID=A0AAD7S394_9TELE|nr:hypothetical protein AAFF_G00036330 [Aldrovandia affinis]
MTSCPYPTPPPERERRYQHKVSLVVRYFMIPCNICLILLATSTLGFAVLLFLNNYKPVHFTPAQPLDGRQLPVLPDSSRLRPSFQVTCAGVFKVFLSSQQSVESH